MAAIPCARLRPPTWAVSRLGAESAPGAWRTWEYGWDAASAGHFILEARATDTAGRVQPEAMPWNFRGYANNGIHAIAVEAPERG